MINTSKYIIVFNIIFIYNCKFLSYFVIFKKKKNFKIKKFIKKIFKLKKKKKKTLI